MIVHFIFALIPFVQGVVYLQPEHIHLAYGGDNASDIVVTWSTKDKTNSTVEYGIGELNFKANGTIYLFEDSNKKKSQYIHRVTLSNLTPGQNYSYHCGSEQGWSAVYSFKTRYALPNQPLSFAVFGDLGNSNAKALPQLQQDAQKGEYDAIIHLGDFAYNLYTESGKVGDEFMNQIEPVAAYVPYMTCPGNHEKTHNFTHYRVRFSMPGLPDRLYYSINIGSVHLISINTETYFTVDDELATGLRDLASQYSWLERDLKEANKPENRQKQPWIFFIMHKPMYCSDSEDQCTQNENFVRDGLPVLNRFGLEELLHDNGVDLIFVAHEHSYERTWPVYKGKVQYDSVEEAYTNPKAPVHIKSGSIGADSHSEGYRSDPLAWSAFRTLDYGYTKIKVFNSTHLYLEQTSTSDKEDGIIDRMWLIQGNHGPFNATVDA